MFQGYLPHAARSLLGEHSENWDCEDVFVGCSGNFTIERTLDSRFQLHSNDVSVYSYALGCFLAGVDFELELRDEQGEYSWLGDSMGSPIEKAATVLAASSELSQTIGKSNAYYDRLRNAYRSQWKALHGKTVAKLELLATKMRLASFSAEDVVSWAGRVPPDAAFALYPVTASAYASDFTKLGTIFRWPAPPASDLTLEVVEQLFERVADRRHWFFASGERLEDQERHLRGMTKTSNRGAPLYLYGSDETRRIVQPRQRTTPILFPRLGPDEELGEGMALSRLSLQQFTTLRSEYLNPMIAPVEPQLSLGVFVEKKLVGCVAWVDAKYDRAWDHHLDGPHAYLLSDFPVSPSAYKHLAKLIVYAALSREAQLLVERTVGHRVRSAVTTAFAGAPASMKYRGLLNLYKRVEQPDGYELNYGAPVGAWTLDEGLALWRAKHGARAIPAESA